MNSIFKFFWNLSHGRFGLMNTFWIFGIAIMQGIIPVFINMMAYQWPSYGLNETITDIVVIVLILCVGIFYTSTLCGIWVSASIKNSPKIHVIFRTLGRLFVLITSYTLIMKVMTTL